MTVILDNKSDRLTPTAMLPAGSPDVQYPPSEIPMSLRDWIVAGVIAAAVLVLVPMNWHRASPLPAAGDYRIPYELSNDYWLFDQVARREAAEGKALLVGDSVIWGHYVSAPDSLSGQLNRRSGAQRFANLGVDGIHPAALAGLIEHFGGSIAGRDVVLHCNLLWMSSPRRDLREGKEFAFNHPKLVPQFYPWIDCYGEGVSGRLTIAVGRELPFSPWANHLRLAYFEGKDIPAWTLDHPYACPIGAIMHGTDAAQPNLPPGVTAEAWTQRQGGEFPAQWVDLASSFQWQSFRRALELLRKRGNRVFVVVGPFNVYRLKGGGLKAYHRMRGQVEAWLKARGVAYSIAPALPSEQYADASHPLSEGYATMARQLLADKAFASFVTGPGAPVAATRGSDQ